MKKSSTLAKVEKEIERLPPEDLIRLMDGILHRLRKDIKSRSANNWETLYGAGKEVWKEDAQTYVDRLREDRP